MTTKKDIKEYLGKIASYEECNNNGNKPQCDITQNLYNKINKLDLRKNRNKNVVLEKLHELRKSEGCNYCSIGGLIERDLVEKWKRNNLY